MPEKREVSVHYTNGKRQRVRQVADFKIAETATEATEAHSDFITSHLDGGTQLIINWKNTSAVGIHEPPPEDIPAQEPQGEE